MGILRSGLDRKAFAAWISCLIIPFSVGSVLSFILLLCYTISLSFLFTRGEDSFFYLLAFVYVGFALPYSVFAYLRYGRAIPRSLAISWHYDCARWIFKNYFISLPLVVSLLLIQVSHQPPPPSFSDLDVIEDRVAELESRLQQIPLALDKATSPGAFSSYESLDASGRYSVFYGRPSNRERRLPSEDLDALYRSYWRFKGLVQSSEESLASSKYLLEEKRGGLQVLESEIEDVNLSIGKACSIELSSDLPEDSRLQKEAYCNKLLSRTSTLLKLAEGTDFSVFSSRLLEMEDTVSEGKTYLQDWNDWIASMRGLGDLLVSLDDVNYWLDNADNLTNEAVETSDSVDEAILNSPEDQKEISIEVDSLMQLVAELEERVLTYEDSVRITREAVSLAERDLSSLLSVLQAVSRIDNNMQQRTQEIRDYSDSVESSLSEFTRSIASGESLLAKANAQKVEVQALEVIPTVLSQVEALNKIRSGLLVPLKTELEKDTEVSTSFHQGQSRVLGTIRVSSKNLEKRLNFFIQKSQSSLIVSTIKWIVAISVVVITAAAMFLYYRKVVILKGIKNLNGKEIDALLNKIMSPKELVAIRKEAVQLINDYQDVLKEYHIKRLKTAVAKLEKSSSEDDIKVNSELRSVTESLELRLMEKRLVAGL